MNTKSATTAGLLGIFLGAFGAHNWYLGEKGKGIAHVCMMSGGLIVNIVAGIVLPSVLSFSALLTAAGILAILGGVAVLAMSASGIWGFVEGIIILTQGDAGLARKGYAVAGPVPPMGYNNYGPQNNMGNNMQGYNNYGPQGNMNGNMNNMGGMNNSMPNNMGGMQNGNMGQADNNQPMNNMGGNNNGQQ